MKACGNGRGHVVEMTLQTGLCVGHWLSGVSTRVPWAGPGFNDILRAGPDAGLKLAGPGRARAGPGLVNNTFAGCGPGLTFPGLGRTRASCFSHSCFNIMVKYYPQLSIAMSALFSTLNVTAICNTSHWLQERPGSQYVIHSILNNGPQPLNFSRVNSKEAVRLSVHLWLNIINSLL